MSTTRILALATTAITVTATLLVGGLSLTRSAAPEFLPESVQWQINLAKLQDMPAPEATCRTVTWEKVDAGMVGLWTISYNSGEDLSARFTELPDYEWNVAATELTAENYRTPSANSAIDRHCVANILTPTAPTAFGSVVMDEPVWEHVTENTTKFGKGFTHVTTGMSAPEFEFRYFNSNSSAANLLLKEVLSDPLFVKNLSDVGEAMDTAESIAAFTACDQPDAQGVLPQPGECLTNSDRRLQEAIGAFGLTDYQGRAASGATASETTLAALNAYAKELINDYYN